MVLIFFLCRFIKFCFPTILSSSVVVCQIFLGAGFQENEALKDMVNGLGF